MILARRQARALLYYLANAGTLISRDQLLYLFWPDETGAKARRNLTRLASYLRQELPHPEILRVTRESLQLNPEWVWVDAERFSRMCAEAATQEQAVSLYRGVFLTGFSLASSSEFDFWLTEEQGRYEALYLQTLAEMVRIKGRQGAYGAAIEYAQKYLAVDNLAEEMHRQLITLFAAHGNRASALKQYEICVKELERELGVSPLPKTRAAYEAAQMGARAVDRPPTIKPAWKVLPSLELPLIGREAAWSMVESAYQKLHTGGMILISGEAGMGKTRLMQEFATRNQPTVLTGNHHPGTQTLPYHALLQALRQAVQSPEIWEGILPLWMGELSQILPELHDLFVDLPQPLTVEPEQSRARLFEALTQVFWGLAARAGPLLLCLDDLHWVDEASMSWLSSVSTRLADSKLCILGTYRTEERASLMEMRSTIQREQLLAEVDLTGLSTQAIDEILQQVPGETLPDARLAAHLQYATGGNAFFVLETVRALLETQQLNALPDTLPLPNTLQEIIHTRLMRLTPLARQIIDAATVLSPDLEMNLLAQTGGRTELETSDGLDELFQRQLLQEEGSRFAFRHDLLRLTVYQALNPWRRQILHRRAGDVFRESYARNPEEVAAQMAQHYDAAGANEQAVAAYQLAASSAQQVYAHDEAITYLERACKLVADVPGSTTIIRNIHEALADNFTRAGAFADAEKAYRAALTGARKEEPLQTAELQCKLAAILPPQHRQDDAETICRDALTSLDAMPSEDRTGEWDSVRLDLLLNLLDVLYYQHKPEAMTELHEETIQLLDKVGTGRQQIVFYTRWNQRDLLSNQFHVSAENVVRAQKALAYAEKTKNPGLISREEFHLGFLHLWHGDLHPAEEMLRRALATAEEIGDLWLQVQCLVYLTITYRIMGDEVQVKTYIPQLVAFSQRLGFNMYIGVNQANTAWLHYIAGEWLEAQTQAEAAVVSWAETDYPFQWLANWIILALAHRENRLPDAIAAIQSILNPEQRQHPAQVVEVLLAAMAAWKSHDESATRSHLSHALKIAGHYGYL